MASPFIFFKDNFKNKTSFINLLRNHGNLNNNRLDSIIKNKSFDEDTIRKLEIHHLSKNLDKTLNTYTTLIREEILSKIDQPISKLQKLAYLKEKLIEINDIGNNIIKIIVQFNPDIEHLLEKSNNIINSHIENNKYPIKHHNEIITNSDIEREMLKFSEYFYDNLNINENIISKQIIEISIDEILILTLFGLIERFKILNSKLIDDNKHIIPEDHTILYNTYIPILVKTVDDKIEYNNVNFNLNTIKILLDKLPHYLKMVNSNDLNNALKNQEVENKIIYIGETVYFAELFKRIRYNNGLTANNSAIVNWITKYFLHQKTNKDNEDDFNYKTLKNIFENNSKEGTVKHKRILIKEFKYASPDFRK